MDARSLAVLMKEVAAREAERALTPIRSELDQLSRRLDELKAQQATLRDINALIAEVKEAR